MRYCNTLAEYEQAKTDGIINDDVLVIVLDEKVAKFKGQTFDWGGGGGVSAIYVLGFTIQDLDNAIASNEGDFDISDYEDVLAALTSGTPLHIRYGENYNGYSIVQGTEDGAGVVSLEFRYARWRYTIDLTNNGGYVSRVEDVSVDTELSETSENAISNSAVTRAMVENEEVTAAALNELNERVNEISENVSGGAVTKEEFEEAIKTLSDADVAINEAISEVDEKVSSLETTVADTYATKAELEENVDTINGAIDTLQKEVIDNEEVVAAALNDLNTRLNEILTRLNNAGI